MLSDYRMFCVSVRGASHIQEGTPKEDAAGKAIFDHGMIGVVSDGHGDARCMRSSLGSDYAVRIATCCLARWLDGQRPAEAQGEKEPEAKKEERMSGKQDDAFSVGAEALSAGEGESDPQGVTDSFSRPKGSDDREENTPGEKDDTEPEAQPPEKGDAAEDPWSDEGIMKLCREIAGKWKKAVTAHFGEHPLTEEEIKAAGNLYPVYAEGRRIPHIYGATLLAAVMTDEKMLLIQKGDGHAVFIYEDGSFDHEVIPWDKRCELNFTTSLCDEDSQDTFQCAVVDMHCRPAIAAVVLASDGMEDCFSDMEAADVFVGQTAYFGAKEGMEDLENYLESELSVRSDRASRDDISMVGWIDPQAMLPLGRRYDLMGEEFRARNMLKEAQLRIGSMSASKQRLEEHMRRMEENIAALEKEQEELKARQEELKELQEKRRTRMQEDPSMRALQGILTDLGKSMNELYEKVRTFGGLREASENDRGELEKIAGRLEAGEKELASLQKEYDGLKGKYTEYTGRYKQWTDRKDAAISILDRLRNEIASVDAPVEESEDAEEAFRRMMED